MDISTLTQLISVGKDFLGGGDSDDDTIRACLLYTSPSPRDRTRSRMPSSA